LNAGDGIQIGVAVVLTLTLLAVCWYAWEARKQAKASVRMAEEMREQRLAEDRPHLLIGLTDWEPGGWEGRPSEGETVQDSHPSKVTLVVRNVGRGPAKDLVATAVHPKKIFSDVRRGFLLQEVTPWEFSLSPDILGQFLAARRRLPFPTLGEWLADHGVHPQPPVHSPLGVVVEYRDIYERRWVSYLELDYESDTGDQEGELIWYINPGKQSAVGPLPPGTPPAAGGKS
jgi:hypothetical protein